MWINVVSLLNGSAVVVCDQAGIEVRRTQRNRAVLKDG